MLILDQFNGFDWDEWNKGKNWKSHKVSDLECEEIFFNQPLFVFFDEKHLEQEERYYVLGRTNKGRRLYLVFTARRDKIRVISARDMTKRERSFYPL